jgi:hypothetical protein
MVFASRAGYLEEQKNEKQEHAEDAEGAEEFVVGDGAAEDGFEGLVAEEGFEEAVEQACDEAEDAEGEGCGHRDEKDAGGGGHGESRLSLAGWWGVVSGDFLLLVSEKRKTRTGDF